MLTSMQTVNLDLPVYSLHTVSNAVGSAQCSVVHIVSYSVSLLDALMITKCLTGLGLYSGDLCSLLNTDSIAGCFPL